MMGWHLEEESADVDENAVHEGATEVENFVEDQ